MLAGGVPVGGEACQAGSPAHRRATFEGADQAGEHLVAPVQLAKRGLDFWERFGGEGGQFGHPNRDDISTIGTKQYLFG